MQQLLVFRDKDDISIYVYWDGLGDRMEYIKRIEKLGVKYRKAFDCVKLHAW